ncbi:MAG: PilC/PilY family type IV pilus protein [Casimicrobiaceae bacterium]
MNAKNLRRAFHRSLVALVSLGLVLGPLGDAFAQTRLGDIPIASKVQAKPNIVYSMDDSGSMQFSYLPDWVIAGGVAAVSITSITRLLTTATATVSAAAWGTLSTGQYITIFGANQPEYNGTFKITMLASPKFTFQVVATAVTPATGVIQYTIGVGYCRTGSNTGACAAQTSTYSGTFQSPPFYAAEFNTLAYNPDVTYTPPVKADNAPLTHLATDTNMVTGDQIYANAQTFPYPGDASLTTHVNLTGKVNVPIYCNTDWPLTVGGPSSNLTVLDLGDANAEGAPSAGVPNVTPIAGTGSWCRINGTPYGVSAASGAPAVNADYNYPYQSSTGAKGTQYFFKSLGNKILYCDTSSPYYPRNPGVITGCLTGAPIMGMPGPPKTQTCNVNPKTCNPTAGLRNWTKPVLPDVCNNTALYCLPNQGTPVASDGNSLGTGLPPECLPCQCKSDYQPLPLNKCSITGASCPAACGTASCDPVNCPDQPGTPAAITGCTLGGQPIYQLGTATCGGKIWDPATNSAGANTALQDALAQGYACRHNNQTYAVTAAGGGTPFTYPRTNLGDVYAANRTGIAPYKQTGTFTQAITSGCPTIGATIAIPRHYYQIASVKFCDTIDTTANSQWKGYGIGACQTSNDLSSHQIVQYGKFTRVGLVNDARTFPYTDQLTGFALARTYAQESQNYANWFAYYRLRAHAAKATSSLAFSLLDDSYRVGFQNLGPEGKPTGGTNPAATTWVDVGDFKGTTAGTTRFDFWTALFGIPTVTTYKTPIMSAMIRVGSLFETGASGGLPSDLNALPGGAKDPLNVKDTLGNVISCQSNFHILFTDGFNNQVYLPVIAGEKDDTMPAWPAPGLMPDLTSNPDNVMPDFLPSGAAWPTPYRWGTKAVPNTLADIAMNYWAKDLRGGLKNNVPSDSGKTPNDLDPVKDPAWWQHMQFSAISFGASGTLDASSSGAQAATVAAIKAGTQQWPDLTAPNNPQRPAGNKGAVAVDDLWHAAVNARGIFVYAKSPVEVQLGLGRILGRIANNRKSATGAGFSGQVLSATNDIIYEPTIEPGWSGDLLKVQIDPKTGAEVATIWQANTRLTNQILPGFVGDEPWLNESKRRIVSWDPALPPGGKPVAFRAVAGGSLGLTLSTAQLNTLSNLNPLMQYRMVSYLRGGSTVNPPYGPIAGYSIEGSDVGQFRTRTGKLGDISHAQPLVITATQINPEIFNQPAADPGYLAFATTNSMRVDQVVAAANDGMVHVIDSVTGDEVWAFVPNAIFRSPPAPPLTPPCTQAGVDEACKPNGLQALTFQDGPPSIYKHHFYVDSSPRTSDVDFNSAGVKGGASDWHTIVVGGLGKGGNSYYALDLTDPATPDEAAAGAKVLWEVTDPDWKYTYGRPVIAKTYAYGWVVIVTSGYNNVSGEGRIYFLDPKTGKQVGRKYLNTPKVTCTGPDGVLIESTGMAQINGFTKDFHNQFTEQIYGGDLCGNLWRFDVSDPNDGAWTVDNFALLTDPLGKPQPVTTAPQIEIDYKNGADRYVFIGTGQLLDDTDLTNPSTPQVQTMWAIRDGSLSKVRPSLGLPLNARAITMAVDAVTGAGIIGGAPDGWHHDLPDGTGAQPAQRIVVDVAADVSAVLYIGTEVPVDPCTIALPVDIYGREYASGKSLIFDSTTPTQPWIHDDSGGVGLQIVGMPQYDAFGNLTGYTLGAILSHENPGAVPVPFANPSALGRNRFSWRLLSGE